MSQDRKLIAIQLENLALEIKLHSQKLATEVREGGQQSQQGFERLLSAVHEIHHLLGTIPEQLMEVAKLLRAEK